MLEKLRPKTRTAPRFQNDGYCYCCDSRTQFVATSDCWRDDYRCTNCNSLPRERALMFCIEQFFPQWRTLSTHESSPVLGRGAKSETNERSTSVCCQLLLCRCSPRRDYWSRYTGSYDITNFIFGTSGLFTEIVFLDILEYGIRVEYIEVLISRKFRCKNSQESPRLSLQQ